MVTGGGRVAIYSSRMYRQTAGSPFRGARPSASLALTLATEAEGGLRTGAEPAVANGLLTPAAISIVIVVHGQERCRDELPAQLGAPFVSRGHLLLLHSVHTGETTDRGVEVYRLSVVLTGSEGGIELIAQ